ncbi:MAG: response regulator transcription factor [Pseudomonadales bacterium]|nr:response regulator transcription factor [Pseudomonadales bacterium]
MLTDRQITILSNLVEGLSNKQIARKLDIADGTVRVHMSTIYRVLGVENRTQAVVKAGKLGI